MNKSPETALRNQGDEDLPFMERKTNVKKTTKKTEREKNPRKNNQIL